LAGLVDLIRRPGFNRVASMFLARALGSGRRAGLLAILVACGLAAGGCGNGGGSPDDQASSNPDHVAAGFVAALDGGRFDDACAFMATDAQAAFGGDCPAGLAAKLTSDLGGDPSRFAFSVQQVNVTDTGGELQVAVRPHADGGVSEVDWNLLEEGSAWRVGTHSGAV
jgi:hypothetical protein